MKRHCLTPDYSMSRLISTLKEFSISKNDIEDMEFPNCKESFTATKSSLTPEDMTTPPTENDEVGLCNKKRLKHKRKEVCLKTNHNF